MLNRKSPHRILIFRLSSLGDIILCTSALSAISRIRPGAKVDWVIGSEFSSLLEGDPRINNRVQFKRSAGFFAWHQLCRRLFNQGYDEVLDLHASLRTRYARLYFWFRSLMSFRRRPIWKALPKPMWRRVGFFTFKKYWPVRFRPSALGGLSVQAARLYGGEFIDRPDLTFLLGSPVSTRVREWIHQLKLGSSGYLTVMPGAAWPGKRWPVEAFLRLFTRIGLPVAVLGTEKDPQSRELFSALQAKGVSVVPAFHKLSFTETAQLIRESQGLISNDTGMVHFAEALGISVLAIFGPTDPDLGFAPWRENSRTISSSLWCRPCSKDGSACYRAGGNRFKCLKELSPERVEHLLRRMISEGMLG